MEERTQAIRSRSRRRRPRGPRPSASARSTRRSCRPRTPRRRPSAPPRSRKRPRSSAGSWTRARAEAGRLVESARSEMAQDVTRARQAAAPGSGRPRDHRRRAAHPQEPARRGSPPHRAGRDRPGRQGQLAVTLPRADRPALRQGPLRRGARGRRDGSDRAGAGAGRGESSPATPGPDDVLTAPVDQARGAPRGGDGDRAERAGAGKLVQDFVGLVAERGRADHLPEIVGGLPDARGRRARPRPRPGADRGGPHRRTRSGSSRASSSTRSASASSWKSRSIATLLGGFIAQVGSLIFDGSLDGQLARMRQRLARG